MTDHPEPAHAEVIGQRPNVARPTLITASTVVAAVPIPRPIRSNQTDTPPCCHLAQERELVTGTRRSMEREYRRANVEAVLDPRKVTTIG
jgi:hypothetical protein